MSAAGKLKALAHRWADANAAERANFQPYLIELCNALGVEPPRPAGSGYEFEYPITQTLPDGREAPGFIDCYKRSHFVLEAKDEEEGRSREAMLRLAFGQAKARLANLPDPAPPYLLVMDVGSTLIVWDRWDGGFGGFQAGRRSPPGCTMAAGTLPAGRSPTSRSTTSGTPSGCTAPAPASRLPGCKS